jgi:hypothetical protein
VALAGAIALLVSHPRSSAPEGPLRPAGSGNEPLLSVVGADAVTLSKPPSGGGMAAVDVPARWVSPLAQVWSGQGVQDGITVRTTTEGPRFLARGPPVA